MVPESSRKKTFAPAILGVAGGLLALIAYALHWGTVAILSGRAKVTIKGGMLAVVLGAVIVACALLMASLGTRRGAISAAIVQLVVAAMTLGIGLYFLLSDSSFLRAAANHFSDVTGRPADRIEDFLHLLATRGGIAVTRSAGIYLFTIGGALAIVAAILGAVAARSLGVAVPARPGMPFPGAAPDQPAGGARR